MDVLKEISEYGKSLDLTGADLQKFIHQQQAFHRDQRAPTGKKRKKTENFFLRSSRSKLKS